MIAGICSDQNKRASAQDNTEKKKKAVDSAVRRLHKIAEKSIKKRNYETALEAISACAELEYYWNQFYVDEHLEKLLSDMQKDVVETPLQKKGTNKQTILFYDGFGYDTRGLMLNYIDALLSLGYRVVYVTVENAKGRQPTLNKITAQQNFVWEYLPASLKTVVRIQHLNKIFAKYHPSKAFLYTLPYDVAGVVVFASYQGIVERYQINLTDHAFWLGKYAFDYCIEFRDYGASVSKEYRGIDPAKLIKLPLTPYVDDTADFEGFPFDPEGYKVVFSGGGLYKTFDEDNTYYKLVEDMLRHDEKVLFLYAGFGDDSELKKLMEKFPGRVWHIDERRDLYQLMGHIYFYLSTYPMAGGLMTQYAALAGRVPVTLGEGDELKGLLCVPENCQYLFRTKEEVQKEIYKLLDDSKYVKARGQQFKASIPGKKQFGDALGQIFREHESPYMIRYEKIETEEFIREYLYRFSLREIQQVMIKDEHWELRKNFPFLFLRKRTRNIINLLRKRG